MMTEWLQELQPLLDKKCSEPEEVEAWMQKQKEQDSQVSFLF